MHQLFEMLALVRLVLGGPASGLGGVAKALEKGTQYPPQFAHLALRFQEPLAGVRWTITGRLSIARSLQSLNHDQLIGILIHGP